ncbi:hypothetical protein [Enterococcus diestrammenae]|nr:hypothetical protein [Enterococcus diestrammenae]
MVTIKYSKSHITVQADGHTHICIAGSWEYLVVYDLLVSLLLI